MYFDKRHVIQILVVLMVAISVRLVMTYPLAENYDTKSFKIAADLMSQGKIVYEHTKRYNYPPLWMWVLLLIQMLTDVSHLPFAVLVKLPAILADSGICLLIYVLFLRSESGERAAMAGALFYALNPVAILISGHHGQFGSVWVFFCLLAWYFWNSRKMEESAFLSGLALGIAILFKPIPVILLPVFVGRLRTARQRFVFSTLALFPVVAATLPYFLIAPSALLENVILYSSNYGSWGYGYPVVLVILRRIVHYDFFNMLITITENYGKYFLLLVLFYQWIFVCPRISLISAITLVFATLYFCSSGFGVQYLIWILPFAIINRESALKYYTIFTTVYLIFMYAVMAYDNICFDWLREIISKKNFGYIASALSLPVWLISGLWMSEKMMDVKVFAALDYRLSRLKHPRGESRDRD